MTKSTVSPPTTAPPPRQIRGSDDATAPVRQRTVSEAFLAASERHRASKAVVIVDPAAAGDSTPQRRASNKRPSQTKSILKPASSTDLSADTHITHPTLLTPTRGFRRDGGKINPAIPISYNLSRLMSQSLLSQLSRARDVQRVTTQGSENQRQTRNIAMISGKDFRIPPDSRGIALGIYRESRVKTSVRPSMKQKRELMLLSQLGVLARDRRDSVHAVPEIQEPVFSRPRKMSIHPQSVTAPAAISSVNVFDSAAVDPAKAAAIPLPGRRASILVRDSKRGSDIFSEDQEVLNSLGSGSERRRSTIMGGNAMFGRSGRRRSSMAPNAGLAVPSNDSSLGSTLSERSYGMADFISLRKDHVEKHCVAHQVTLAKVPVVRRRLYLMKAISKKQLSQNQILLDNVRSEKAVMTKLISRFCTQLLATMQTPQTIFMVIEWAPTSLNSLLAQHRSFTEPQARFYMAEITCAMDFIHSNNVIHRNLSPLTILLDAKGHIKVSDFSFSVAMGPDERMTSSHCQHRGKYLAPEILVAERHGCSSDWFSIGAIFYEMLTGNVPFGTGNILDAVAFTVAKLASVEGTDGQVSTTGSGNEREASQLRDTKTGKCKVVLPSQYKNLCELHNVSRPAEDLVRRLMEPDPHIRITAIRGSGDVRTHPWLRSVPLTWKEIEDGEYSPPDPPGLDEDETKLASIFSSSTEPGGHGGNNGSQDRAAVETMVDDFASEAMVYVDGKRTFINADYAETFDDW